MHVITEYCFWCISNGQISRFDASAEYRVSYQYFVLLPARRYASAGYRDRNVSVCPSVCHAPVLCQNEES